MLKRAENGWATHLEEGLDKTYCFGAQSEITLIYKTLNINADIFFSTNLLFSAPPCLEMICPEDSEIIRQVKG